MARRIRKFSFSGLSTFLSCPKKYYWEYVRKLTSLVEPSYFVDGSNFHAGAAHEERLDIYKDKWYRIGELSAKFFGSLPGQVDEVDGQIQISPTVIVRGTADGLSKDMIIERKTTSRANAHMLDALANSLQNRLYGKIFGRKKGIIQITKKPQIRIKKNETEIEFDQRFLQLFKDDPQDWFASVDTDLKLDGVEEEILQIVRSIRSCERSKMWPGGQPHTCYSMMPCKFLKLCLSEETFISMYKPKPTEEERKAQQAELEKKYKGEK